ncbi:hypothetical protein [Chitinilyticum piscinae]|uniref:Uncharacterized protein n=1 Tax=Chitinilyticum piscinae TaxID=2866724 RepID=A0A8J7FNJ3_9NEIS|nr:hypothetical protein [Chitinilyticum piscinae]MBE9610036.1 hypothetical protein [Chitinilyticum piscinae]
MRYLAWFGLALLLPLLLFAVFVAIRAQQWAALLAMLGLGAIVFGLGCLLRREATPRHVATEDAAADFLKTAFLGMPEGLIVLAGAAVCLVFAALGWYRPELLGVAPARASAFVTLFAFAPLFSAALYLRSLLWNRSRRAFDVLLTLAITLMPFAFWFIREGVVW